MNGYMFVLIIHNFFNSQFLFVPGITKEGILCRLVCSTCVVIIKQFSVKQSRKEEEKILILFFFVHQELFTHTYFYTSTCF